MNDEKETIATMESGEAQNVENSVCIDIGAEDGFYVANDGDIFGIPFDKIFGQEAYKVYNNFMLSSKRNFKNLTPIIYESYNEIFLNENHELKEEAELIMFNLLRIKSEIMVAESTSQEKFIGYMDEIMNAGDKALINLITNFVLDHYALELDKTTQETRDKNRNVNNELMFSDEHAKELLKIAYLYRIMIPIISEYYYYNKGAFITTEAIVEEESEEENLLIDDPEEMAFDEVNSKIFAHLFEQMSKNPDALRNKIYKLTYSGVSKTGLSDKKFWNIVKNLAITEESETLEIYKKVLTNAISKLSIDKDKNVISFLTAVINNQVGFIFQSKFRYKLQTLGNSDAAFVTEDDDAITDFDRIETQHTRKDEGGYIIRKKNIKEALEYIPEKFNVGVSDAEVKDAMTKIKRNAIQEQIIAFLTFKYFEDKDALKFVSFYDYCKLLLVCKKHLEQQKYIYLPLILTAKCEKHRERINISGKKVRPEILNSKKYKELISEKYDNFSSEIEKPFLAFIGTVYSSVFKNENDEEIFDSTIKVGKIAQELVSLAKLI